MKFHLYKVSGYEEAIMAIRMSKGKAYSLEKAQEIQDLVYVCTDRSGFLANPVTYESKLRELAHPYIPASFKHGKITGDYNKDIAEFKRLLGITMNMAMGEQTHHTLIKYIDISFFTDGLHRGAQDDLDAHAMAFMNRITRFSTRLANIDEVKLSEWYQDKLIPFPEAFNIINSQIKQEEMQKLLYGGIVDSTKGFKMPDSIQIKGDNFIYTPFGYMLERYANISHDNGLYKDVARGGMPLGLASSAIWKADLFDLRYVYHMRSKLTKANPELRDGIEMLADQIESNVPVFGEHFRHVFTDTGSWEHTNRTRTVTKEEYEAIQRMKAAHCPKETDERE